MRKSVLVAILVGVLSFGCMGCSVNASDLVSNESPEKQGEEFITAMRPYLEYLGKETVDGSVSISDELVENSDSIIFCWIEGTVSYKLNDATSNTVSICDWESNEPVDEGKYDEAVDALAAFYGQEGETGISEDTPEFGSFDYVQWDDADVERNVTVFMAYGILHVRWWPEDETSSNPDDSSSYDSDSSDSADDYSHNYSNNDYSSDGDSEYDYLYDEDSGISGVYDTEDGDGLFAGDDFSMRLNEDGSSIATDGNGNWVVDSDGDGEVDAISIDGGDTWF